MRLDDTRDRIYIHDLDEELADAEPNEERLIFLPDIEKKLSKIPAHVLTGDNNAASDGQQLVLYSVPSSLSVPEADDNVRKAIVDARRRARDKTARDAAAVGERMGSAYSESSTETAHGLGAEDHMVEDKDPDAMDIE